MALIQPPSTVTPPATRSSRLKAAWADFYGDATALAVTLELYRKRVPSAPPQEVAKAFFRNLDRKLSGPRCANLPSYLRTQGYLAAEDWSFHPHLHGVVILPKKHSRLPAEPIAYLTEIWNKTHPTGSVHVETLETPEKWLAYSTKRNGIYSKEVFHALDFWRV